MPTPGKVLVVLVLLFLPVWIVLVCTVAELNKKWGAQLASTERNVAKLESDFAALRKNVTGLKDEISLHQAEMTQHLTVLRAQQSDLQKARSEWLENASRAHLEVAGMQETAKRAAATRDVRAAESMQEMAAMQAVEGQVEQLKQEHARLSEELEKLQTDFKSTLDSNRKLLGQLKAQKPS
jgi:hypothetical protein